MDTAGIVPGCEVKNEWKYTSAYPTCLLFLGTNNFTFYVTLFWLRSFRLGYIAVSCLVGLGLS